MAVGVADDAFELAVLRQRHDVLAKTLDAEVGDLGPPDRGVLEQVADKLLVVADETALEVLEVVGPQVLAVSSAELSLDDSDEVLVHDVEPDFEAVFVVCESVHIWSFRRRTVAIVGCLATILDVWFYVITIVRSTWACDK